MEHLLKELKQLIASLSQRFVRFFGDSSNRALQFTGVLGLAAVIYWLYQLQGTSRSKRDPRRASSSRTPDAGPSTSSLQATSPTPNLAGDRKADSKSFLDVQAPQQQKFKNEGNLSWAVRSQLSGIQVLTISAPGVLLKEQSPAELQEAATLNEDATTVFKEICQNTSVYVITQVEDDTGEATCRGALESGGFIGSKTGQIPSHHLLFCSTLDGKVSIVRQLEPQLHIDAHPSTIEDLKRFIRLVHVSPTGRPPNVVGWQNIGSARSLAHLFSPTS